jgi:hypothetical protein
MPAAEGTVKCPSNREAGAAAAAAAPAPVEIFEQPNVPDKYVISAWYLPEVTYDANPANSGVSPARGATIPGKWISDVQQGTIACFAIFEYPNQRGRPHLNYRTRFSLFLPVKVTSLPDGDIITIFQKQDTIHIWKQNDANMNYVRGVVQQDVDRDLSRWTCTFDALRVTAWTSLPRRS